MNKTTLQDLLLKARDAGMSYRAMEEKVERAEKRHPRGMKISRATANNIVLGRQRSPVSDEVIRAVACIADVPEHVAFTAAGRPTNGSPFADELPAGVDDLDPRERRVALDLLRVLVAQRQELNRYAEDTDHQPDDRPAEEPRAQGAKDQKTLVHATDVDSGSDPEGQAADDARPNVWRNDPTDHSHDDSPAEESRAPRAPRTQQKTRGDEETVADILNFGDEPAARRANDSGEHQ